MLVIINFFIHHVYMEATPEIIALMDDYEKTFHPKDNLTKNDLLLQIYRRRLMTESPQLYYRPNLAKFLKLSDFAIARVNANINK